MKNLILFIVMVVSCFSTELNYAPKIKRPIEEKRFVVVIASYNNEKFAQGNLESIYGQNYSNFRIIYTNDASKDRTGEVVLDYVKNSKREIDFTYLENDTNKGAMFNYYTMVSSCENDEIVVIVDGDDRLFHKGVLKRLNQAYASDHVWMTYGQDTSKMNPKGHSGPTPTVNLQDGSFRNLSYRWSHIRTYYAGLFKSIPKENWMHEGKFYSMAQDIAQICFLFDRACEHVYFMPDVLYDYNYVNPLNEFRIDVENQINTAAIIFNKPKLERFYSKSEFL